ncbi:hypothetical protein E4665_07000 [Sporolactobacillus shoreae]|uniref:PrgI family protein n=1 Tax=Sporolactobacillus shoreae TaxID=1465501 RepID=A0A4Z0GQ71_9BACL|nr:hypothetical protein [Sporolactobacillus shoreae]TGA98604.1 hypothetical protein E4665_07000 [Sporolactobacillus shoreae]
MSQMRTFIQTPHNLQVKPGFYGLSIPQWLFVFASAGMAFLTKFLVLPGFSYLYVFLVPITLYVLLMPSRHAAGKSMVQEMVIVLLRDHGVYRSVLPPDKVESAEGGRDHAV